MTSRALTSPAFDSGHGEAPLELPSLRDLRRLTSALGHLVGSGQPAVTFSSLARLCVPSFCDACVVTMSESAGARYAIAHPDGRHKAGRPTPPAGLASPDGHEVAVAVDSPTGTSPDFHGLIVYSWWDRVPTAADAVIGQLIADRAAAAVTSERLADLAERSADKAVNLERALESNRQIGVAIGILMSTRKVTYPAAFDLLRSASQRFHRKLHDIAADVVVTGSLDPNRR